MSASAFLAAVVARVSDRAPAPRVYKMGAVPASPTYPYTAVSVTAGLADAYTLDAVHGMRDYRIALQSFGRSIDSALAYDEAAVDLLLDHVLTVPGYDCGPIRLEVGSAVVRDPDTAGVIGVTSALVFTTTKER